MPSKKDNRTYLAKDIRGHEIRIGDTVAYPHCASVMKLGVIESIGPKQVSIKLPPKKEYIRQPAYIRRDHECVVKIEPQTKKIQA